MSGSKIGKINVEKELTMQNAFIMHGQSYPVSSKKETKWMKLKTDYELELGACLRITDIFSNGCIYEEYAVGTNDRSKTYVQEFSRKARFARWNERVSIRIPFPPTDVICHLYVTFKMPESDRPSLPKTEFILPEAKPLSGKDEEWICPYCGTAISAASKFCYKCGRARSEQVIAKSNVCYFNTRDEVCEKEDAATCIITEYDQNGNLINSVHGICNSDVSLNSEQDAADVFDDDETMWRCPACGAFNRFINTRCSMCGRPR